MKFFLLILLSPLALWAQDFATARDMCEKYGFISDTQPFAQCVQNEVFKQGDKASCKRMAAIIEKENATCTMACIGKLGTPMVHKCKAGCEARGQRLPANCF
jgi:hypothetical protein